MRMATAPQPEIGELLATNSNLSSTDVGGLLIREDSFKLGSIMLLADATASPPTTVDATGTAATAAGSVLPTLRGSLSPALLESLAEATPKPSTTRDAGKGEHEVSAT